MLRLTNTVRDYPWGSPTAIPELLGVPPTGAPAAELWLGAHPGAPSRARTPDGEVPLDVLIASDAARYLGADVADRFGPVLPYLLKVIAADQPLSLQVHPSIERARAGFAREEAAGIPVDRPDRSYKDANHKPELVYPLTPFGALSGFRDPVATVEVLTGLDAPLARTLATTLGAEPTSSGIRRAFRGLLEAGSRPTADEVSRVVDACRARLAAGSSAPEADRTAVLLGEAYPGDPGVVVSLLLNTVELSPGQAMFVPAGAVHAYLYGVGVEIMAGSDNVLRAGLTPKHVDIPELVANVDHVPGPPHLVAPTHEGGAAVFRPPVDEFVLAVATVTGEAELPAAGPRVVLCLDGGLRVSTSAGEGLDLVRGASVFVPAGEGPLRAQGTGTLVQAGVG